MHTGHWYRVCSATAFSLREQQPRRVTAVTTMAHAHAHGAYAKTARVRETVAVY